MKLKWEKDGIKTPLARARGLGSARDGVGHWLHQRMTAIANIPLVLWLVFNIVSLKGASYELFTAWLSQPVNAILMILLILSVFYHAVLGVQTIVEDYVHNEGCKILKLMAIKLCFVAMAVACVFSILKVAFVS